MAFGQEFINIRFPLHWMPVEMFEPIYVISILCGNIWRNVS